MKTIEEIRLENLQSLISKLGGPEIFSGKIGKTPNQVSQLSNGHKGIGSKIAREVEEAINLDRGWMDNDHSRSGDQAPLVEEKIYEAIRNDEALAILAKLSRTVERTSIEVSAALAALQENSPRRKLVVEKYEHPGEENYGKTPHRVSLNFKKSTFKR